MKSKSFIVLAVLFLCACPALATIHFKDGQTHNIDYRITNNVYVDYQTPNKYTKVNWLAGGKIYYPNNLSGYERSMINVLGGIIDQFYSYDSSRVSISGGSIDSLNSRDSSGVNISGGSIRYFQSSAFSFVKISGGSVDNLISRSSSSVKISGGSVSWLGSTGSSQVYISGGSINWLRSYDSSRVDIFDGSINAIYSYDSSRVNITGGSIGGDLKLQEQSQIQIFGFDFTVNGSPFGYGELTSIFGGYPKYEPPRHLTGTLLSGEPIDKDFYIGNNARIILIPEPATILLLGLGGLMLRKRHDG